MEQLLMFAITLAMTATVFMTDFRGESSCTTLVGIENTSADYVLGGLFPAHYYDSGHSRFQFNLQGTAWVEAMLYTIKVINTDPNILPNLTLGYRIFDTCNTEALATEATLNFLLDDRRYQSNASSKAHQPHNCCLSSMNEIIAVIGDASSAVASSVATLLSVDKIPEISYSATSPALGDKTIYPSFLRTIPSDHFQASLVVDLLTHFNWTYVAVLASDDEYGRAGANYLIPKLKQRGICLSMFVIFNPSFDSTEIETVVTNIKNDVNVRVIILWCERPSAYAMLNVSSYRNLYDRVWIGTETWSNYDRLLDFDPRVVTGLIGIAPHVANEHKFKQYLDSKDLCDQHINIWLSIAIRKYLQLNCSNVTPQLLQSQNQNLRLSDLLPGNKIGNVVDAVTAIALSLDAVVGKKGKNTTVDPIQLLRQVKSVHFIGFNGHNVSFDENGDLEAGAYSIINVQNNEGGGLNLEAVATWNLADRKIITKSGARFQWPGGKYVPPVSKCAEPCVPGQFALVNPTRPCCWECVNCSDGSVQAEAGATHCVKCSEEQIANKNKTKCLNLHPTYLKLSSFSGRIIITFSCIGITFTCLVALSFIRGRKTPVIKSSNVHLSCLQLVSILLLYVIPFLLAGKPTTIFCVVNVTSIGCLSTLSISSTLTKTERLLRIFRARHRLSRKTIKLGNRVQYIIVIVLTSLQLVVSAIYFFFHLPKVLYIVNKEEIRIEWYCADATLTMIAMTSYIIIMAMLVAIIGFRARKLPSDYNEAKSIALAMLIYGLCWACYVVLYFSIQSVTSKSLLLCIVILLTNTDILLILYLPKLCFLYRNPKKVNTLYFHETRCSNHRPSVIAKSGRETDVKQKWQIALSSINVTRGLHSRKVAPIDNQANNQSKP